MGKRQDQFLARVGEGLGNECVVLDEVGVFGMTAGQSEVLGSTFLDGLYPVL